MVMADQPAVSPLLSQAIAPEPKSDIAQGKTARLCVPGQFIILNRKFIIVNETFINFNANRTDPADQLH